MERLDPVVQLLKVESVAPNRAATPLTLRQLPICKLSKILVRAAICALALPAPPTDILLPVRLKDLTDRELPTHCLSKIDNSLHLAKLRMLMDEDRMT
jgi:hypothetical protein